MPGLTALLTNVIPEEFSTGLSEQTRNAKRKPKYINMKEMNCPYLFKFKKPSISLVPVPSTDKWGRLSEKRHWM